MENSSSSENNSPNNYGYYRMNSEVIEKPSHFVNGTGSDCEEDSLEILALLSSPDNSPPCEQEVRVLDHGSQSPRSSTKGDGK